MAKRRLETRVTFCQCIYQNGQERRRERRNKCKKKIERRGLVL
jgi:hypothetical protein